MKNEEKRGRLDYSELRTPPEKHELATANYFVNRGKDVSFIRPSSICGRCNPDFYMDGRVWETKSPIRYSKSSFEDNFKKAEKQSENIIYDFRRLRIQDEQVYKRELEKRSNSYRIKTLLVILRDGRLLTLKGVFDIIATEVSRPRAA